jgi:hypothetical protein
LATSFGAWQGTSREARKSSDRRLASPSHSLKSNSLIEKSRYMGWNFAWQERQVRGDRRHSDSERILWRRFAHLRATKMLIDMTSRRRPVRHHRPNHSVQPADEQVIKGVVARIRGAFLQEIQKMNAGNPALAMISLPLA